MDLTNSFEVARPIDEAWAALTDVSRVAPCLPGAHLQEVEDGEFRGVVKVRLGRIATEFAGAVTIVERNATDYKVVVNGLGLDSRGEGRAEAIVTAKLEPINDTTTRVLVDTDLTVSGRVAQLSKGVFPTVGANLMAQFAENLASMLDGGVEALSAASRSSGDRARRIIEMPEPDAIDLMDAARRPVLTRVAAIAAVALALIWWRRR
ncbi:MAG: SRPBCC family protein [Acidimicrobiales bacterium]